MTPLERQRRHRAQRKQERAANAHRLAAYRFEQLLHRTLKGLRQLDRQLADHTAAPFVFGYL
ncbi:MAG: hypothetical protein ACLPKW_07460, partial [Acetobacteraceae bacterium]